MSSLPLVLYPEACSPLAGDTTQKRTVPSLITAGAYEPDIQYGKTDELYSWELPDFSEIQCD